MARARGIRRGGRVDGAGGWWWCWLCWLATALAGAVDDAGAAAAAVDLVGAWGCGVRGGRTAHAGPASTARAACRGHLNGAGPISRRKMARAEARRIAAQSRCRCSARMAEGSAPEVDRVAAALERALRVQAPNGPQPPLGSATMGMKERPCDWQPAAVSRYCRL